MLERYYLKPTTLDRIRTCWIADAIEQYVAWLAENRYAARSVLHRVPVLVIFGEFAKARGAKRLEDLPAHTTAFSQMWLEQRSANCRDQRARRGVHDAARNAVQQMLRVVLPSYAAASARRERPEPFAGIANGFFTYLQEERGLKERSVVHYRGHLRMLEAYCHQHRISLDDLSPVILTAFITNCGSHLSPSGQRNLCSQLKVFFRYLLREGLCSTDLSTGIGCPQTYRLSDIPRAISWDEVRRMLDAVDRRSAVGKRDYAILLLLVTYGLRAYEVAGITLDDIDWQRGRLRVSERKAGHSTAYPLSTLVGEAIIDYLQHGRPSTTERCLFFRQIAPYRPLGSSGVHCRASEYLHKIGVAVRRPGAHTLRHTCVTRLVNAEFDLKTIGDYVGHGHPASTQIYTKIDIEALREVALGDGESIL
jgi:integrase/recombinase XerD